jgi:peptidoglycan/LPS O-acetylase OafA/YrhL
MKKICYIDVLRLLAFSFVMIYHIMVDLEEKHIFDFKEIGIFYENANMHIATLGVGLFFMISGAGLMFSTKKSIDLKSFYKKRLYKTLIPMWIVYACWMMFGFVRYHGWFLPDEVPLWRFVFTFFGVDGYIAVTGHGTFQQSIGEWFLGCLLMMYAVFPLLRKCMLKNKWITMIVATAYDLAMAFFYPFQMPAHLNFCIKIYDFVLGMFLILVWEDIKKWSLCITLPVLAVYMFYPKSLPIPSVLKITILCVVVFLIVMQFEKNLSSCKLLQKVLALVRTYSYEVFLVHHVIIHQYAECFEDYQMMVREVVLWVMVVLFTIFVSAYYVKKIEARLDQVIINL